MNMKMMKMKMKMKMVKGPSASYRRMDRTTPCRTVAIIGAVAVLLLSLSLAMAGAQVRIYKVCVNHVFFSLQEFYGIVLRRR
jgi:hypothetical protein